MYIPLFVPKSQSWHHTFLWNGKYDVKQKSTKVFKYSSNAYLIMDLEKVCDHNDLVLLPHFM